MYPINRRRWTQAEIVKVVNASNAGKFGSPANEEAVKQWNESPEGLSKDFKSERVFTKLIELGLAPKPQAASGLEQVPTALLMQELQRRAGDQPIAEYLRTVLA